MATHRWSAPAAPARTVPRGGPPPPTHARRHPASQAGAEMSTDQQPAPRPRLTRPRSSRDTRLAHAGLLPQHGLPRRARRCHRAVLRSAPRLRRCSCGRRNRGPASGDIKGAVGVAHAHVLHPHRTCRAPTHAPGSCRRSTLPTLPAPAPPRSLLAAAPLPALLPLPRSHHHSHAGGRGRGGRGRGRGRRGRGCLCGAPQHGHHGTGSGGVGRGAWRWGRGGAGGRGRCGAGRGGRGRRRACHCLELCD